MNPQQNLVRSVVSACDGDVVLEVFKDEKGEVVRSQSFTKSQLQATRKATTDQNTKTLARIDEMLALFA